MKKTILLIVLACMFTSMIKAVEKEIPTEIKAVTLYYKGAEITRETAIQLEKGESVLKFTGLSPYIRKESIRVSGDKNVTILNVSYQMNYLTELKRKDEIENIRKELEKNAQLIEDENTRISILQEKENFLKNNMVLSGKNEAVNPDELKTINEYYGRNIEFLTLEMLKCRRTIADLQKQKAALNNQLIILNAERTLPSGEILVSVQAAQAARPNLTLNYMVDQASWYPSYDARVEQTGRNMEISYKANISQNTGVDWTNVELTLTNARTDISGNLVELTPWYLDFYNPNTYYGYREANSGVLGYAAEAEEDSDYAAGAAPSMAIRGVSSLNKAAAPMYIVDGVPVDDISGINPDDIASVDVLKDKSATSVYGSRAENGVIEVVTKKKKGSSGPLTIVSRGTSFTEFFIDARQTVLNGKDEQVIRFRESEVEASYEYKTIPRNAANVFLVGKINNWYAASLMDGPVNLYLEKTFAGKSVLSTNQFNDTISLSFGVDNGISVSRDKVTDFTAVQVIGSNMRVKRSWKIRLQNNKQYAVKVIVEDQVPVSSNKEIEVKPLELSGGELDPESGKVSWEVELEPGATHELLLSFEVKYPKDKTINLE